MPAPKNPNVKNAHLTRAANARAVREAKAAAMLDAAGWLTVRPDGLAHLIEVVQRDPGLAAAWLRGYLNLETEHEKDSA